jgi:hypothetical protein
MFRFKKARQGERRYACRGLKLASSKRNHSLKRKAGNEGARAERLTQRAERLTQHSLRRRFPRAAARLDLPTRPTRWDSAGSTSTRHEGISRLVHLSGADARAGRDVEKARCSGPSLSLPYGGLQISGCPQAGSSLRPRSLRRSFRAARPARRQCGSGAHPRCGPRRSHRPLARSS